MIDTTHGVAAHTYSPLKKSKHAATATRIIKIESVPLALETAKDLRKNTNRHKADTITGVIAHVNFPLLKRKNEIPINRNTIKRSNSGVLLCLNCLVILLTFKCRNDKKRAPGLHPGALHFCCPTHAIPELDGDRL